MSRSQCTVWSRAPDMPLMQKQAKLPNQRGWCNLTVFEQIVEIVSAPRHVRKHGTSHMARSVTSLPLQATRGFIVMLHAALFEQSCKH